ncbi:hypothetical protein D7Y15_41920 [Corallococcus sp. AB030]|nr:hypothetical protein D7Y15_41920 [Corallococcus sp. AB030]RUO93069.1 hypothetical protein D7Y11_11310 [Corallococcus sp. AB018]
MKAPLSTTPPPSSHDQGERGHVHALRNDGGVEEDVRADNSAAHKHSREQADASRVSISTGVQSGSGLIQEGAGSWDDWDIG